MKKVLGVVLMIMGVGLGAWLGLWFMFIGGIVDAVELVKGDVDLTGLAVAITVCKIMLASVVGWLSFFIPFAIGLAMIQE